MSADDRLPRRATEGGTRQGLTDLERRWLLNQLGDRVGTLEAPPEAEIAAPEGSPEVEIAVLEGPPREGEAPARAAEEPRVAVPDAAVGAPQPAASPIPPSPAEECGEYALVFACCCGASEEGSEKGRP